MSRLMQRVQEISDVNSRVSNVPIRGSSVLVLRERLSQIAGLAGMRRDEMREPYLARRGSSDAMHFDAIVRSSPSLFLEIWPRFSTCLRA